MPPVKPMLAKSVAKIPPGMHYEAKWDGFRAIVFRDGPEVELGSRTTKTLTRYFPELVESLKESLPERCVLLFGQEGPGLSAEAIAAADAVVEITQYGSTRSINASAAAAIIMHTWVRQHTQPVER